MDLDIPDFLRIPKNQRKQAWQMFKPKRQQRYISAKERRRRELAIKRAARKRAKGEWR
jgi:hypothetical protein